MKKWLFILVFSGLLFNFLNFLILKKFFPFNQETVILHYNSFLGIDEVEFNFSDNKIKIFLPLISSGLIWLINACLGFFLYFSNRKKVFAEKMTGNFFLKLRTNQLGAYFLWSAGLLVQMFVLVYVLAIILINR